jgi:hypothetical protein
MNGALLSADPDLFSWDQADCVPMHGANYSHETYRPQALRRVDIPKPNASRGSCRSRLDTSGAQAIDSSVPPTVVNSGDLLASSGEDKVEMLMLIATAFDDRRGNPVQYEIAI